MSASGPSGPLVFHLPSVCIDVNFILAYVTIGSYILRMATNYTFATVYKRRHTKEMLVIDETAHIAVGLQLLEMSSITTPNECLHKVQISKSFLGKVWRFYRSAIMKKFQYGNCV